MTYFSSISENSLLPSPDYASNSNSTNHQHSDDGKNFMTLLVTQLQHQNPMDPMESNELLSQLTAMTSVSELKSIRSSIGALQNSVNSSQAIDATALIGKKLALDSDQFTVNGDSQPLELSFISPGNKQKIILKLLGAHGDVVSKAEIKTHADETQGSDISRSINKLFGTLPTGRYGLDVSTADGIPIPSYIVSEVQSVSLSNTEEPMLNMKALMPATLSMVRQIAPAD